MVAMAVKRFLYRTGLTLIEIMVTIAILAIAVLGTSAFRYTTALGAREANLKTTAAQIAQLLCESWRGASDPNTFEPTALTSLELASSLMITSDHTMHEVPTDFVLLGAYAIATNKADYHAALLWKEVTPGLRALNIIVAWDPGSSGSHFSWHGTYRSFQLTTYITH